MASSVVKRTALALHHLVRTRFRTDALQLVTFGRYAEAVDIGQHGMAGEFGHMTMDPDGPPCPCGNSGCWELLVSADALAARAAAIRQGGAL